MGKPPVWMVVFHGDDHGACAGSVVGTPGSTVSAHRIVIDLPFHLCMRLFSPFKRIFFCLATRVLSLEGPHVLWEKSGALKRCQGRVDCDTHSCE